MAEPVREAILQQLAATLATIVGTRPWGGTYPDAVTVTRRYLSPVQVQQFPVVCVVAASGSTVEQESTAGSSQALFTHRVKVLLFGYVKGDDVVLAETWAERLWSDVVATLQANATLAGLARDIVVDGAFETDEGELDPVGAFSQGITVIADELAAVS